MCVCVGVCSVEVGEQRFQYKIDRRDLSCGPILEQMSTRSFFLHFPLPTSTAIRSSPAVAAAHGERCRPGAQVAHFPPTFPFFLLIDSQAPPSAPICWSALAW